MDGEHLLQTLKEAQGKYKNSKDGEIIINENISVTSIKVPKSFKYDSFVEISCETTE